MREGKRERNNKDILPSKVRHMHSVPAATAKSSGTAVTHCLVSESAVCSAVQCTVAAAPAAVVYGHGK